MTDLTDRMRTCAAYLIGAEKMGDGGLRDYGRAIIDAADLLIEASNIIEAAAQPQYPPGEAIDLVPPAVEKKYREAIDRINRTTDADLWVAPGGPLPGLQQSGTVSPRVCPRCDSRAGKRVYREGNHLMLACPVCGHAWEFKKTAGMTGG